MDLHKKLAEKDKEVIRLKKENHELKLEIRRLNASTDSQFVAEQSKPDDKVAIYMNLFRGRTDVFARMWVDENDKIKYSPAKVRGAYKPLTKETIYHHLAGKQTIGIYPVTLKNKCYFLAVDFDKSGWEDDVKAFVETSRNYHFPCYIERSRSGNGAHVWFFFAEAVQASLARNLGKFLMGKTLEKRPNRALKSFDRMFPNQDSISKGGVGNLIALPLQAEPRKHGNTLFIDDQFQPIPDQGVYLTNIEKISIESILKITGSATQVVKEANQIIKPSNVTVHMSNMIQIPKEQLPTELLDGLQQLATFNNPAFYKAQARRMSTTNIPRKIDCSVTTNDALLLPRSLIEDTETFLKDKQIKLNIVDDRQKGADLDVHFHGTLKVDQEEAVTSLLKHDNGVLAAGTGFGKTVVSTALIARRQVNTLIIVDRTILIDQWKESLSIFLNIPIKNIGQIGGGKYNPTGKVDIAMVQSLNRKEQVTTQVHKYGQVIVDECHHISAVSFEKVLKNLPAKHVYGLTATPVRKDGLHPIIYMHCGDVRYKTNAKKQAEQRSFHHRLIVRKTNVKIKTEDFQKIYHDLLNDVDRNEMIFNDVLEILEQKRSPIILTERLDHVKILEKKFKGFVKNMIVLSGSMKKKERKTAFSRMASIPDHEEMLLISTGKFIGEGFDHSRLDTLFLTMPISWKGTLQQYVGRLHRDHDGKQEVRVYDYVDEQTPILNNMYQNRLKGYHSLGYTTEPRKNDATEQLKLFE